MTTLIISDTEYGERRCDARCYRAKGEDCSCVCEGVNHGAGLEQARENLRELIKLGFADEVTWFEPQTEPMFSSNAFDVPPEVVYAKNQT